MDFLHTIFHNFYFLFLVFFQFRASSSFFFLFSPAGLFISSGPEKEEGAHCVARWLFAWEWAVWEHVRQHFIDALKAKFKIRIVDVCRCASIAGPQPERLMVWDHTGQYKTRVGLRRSLFLSLLLHFLYSCNLVFVNVWTSRPVPISYKEFLSQHQLMAVGLKTRV